MVIDLLMSENVWCVRLVGVISRFVYLKVYIGCCDSESNGEWILVLIDIFYVK